VFHAIARRRRPGKALRSADPAAMSALSVFPDGSCNGANQTRKRTELNWPWPSPDVDEGNLMKQPDVLVVGASGMLGGQVVKALTNRGAAVRVLARDPDRLGHLPRTVRRLRGDLRDASSVGQALEGVKAAFYVSPHDQAEVEFATTFLRKAESARVPLVFAGVHVPFANRLARAVMRTAFAAALPAYRGKLRVGEMFARSATKPVILVGTHFMQNDDIFDEDIRAGRFPIPLAPAGINRVDVRDIAELAARSLIEPDFLRPGAYPVVGPASHSGTDAAAMWSRALGTAVRYVGDDDDVWMAICRRRVSGRKQSDFLATAKMQQKRGLATNPKQLTITTQLLGRPPRAYGDYVQERAAAPTQTS
jgi:uncharacterized protein YbjT (DUF2867 family)